MNDNDLPDAPHQRLITDHWLSLDWTGRGVVVAVSGGADSVALLRVLAALEPAERPRELVVAHFNHRLRAQAEDDARFVADLAGRLGLAFDLGHADVAALAQEQGDGIEAAAREARYSFLEEVADRRRAHFVATAHTADDQAETVLHRILRGTGVAGLQGIHDIRPVFGRQDVFLIRPLRDIRRATVLEYLAAIHQPYCDDASNLDPRFTRNRIRHQLLPLLEREFNSNVVEALLRLSETARGAQSAINEFVEDLVHEAVEFDTEHQTVVVKREDLGGVNGHLICELFMRIWRDMGWPEQKMGLDHWTELAFEAEAGEIYDEETAEYRLDDAPYKRMFPGKIMAEKKGTELVLTRLLE
jgi:tRNA(Ile)-lysidine synthase